MFSYKRAIEEQREARGENHCEAAAPVHDLRALVRDGHACDPATGSRLTSSPLGPIAGGKWIFAVKNGEIRVAPDGVRGNRQTAKHETLFRNADVDAAGEVHFLDGRVEDLNDVSGTYQTRDSLDLAVVRAQVARAIESTGGAASERVRDFLGTGVR